MRNDGFFLLAILLTFTSSARATPGSWFTDTPCAPDAAQMMVQPGTRVLLSVHYQADAAPRDAVLEFGADQRWRVAVNDWNQWTQVPPSVELGAQGERQVVLQPGDQLAMRLDGCTSELWIDADPHRRHDIDLTRPASSTVARAGLGGYLNLDFNYGGLAGRNVADTVLDLGAFGPGGAGRSDFFVSNQVTRRLDTYWIHDEPGSALRLRLGDGITHAADWEAPVRFGGVQFGTDFSLQPDRITFPLPTISGSAALASTAQLYINGVQQTQTAVQPGQFRFDSVPALTGAGDLSVVIRDNLGRQQTVTQPFYTSARLLAAGLDADTLEAGFLRENYAASDDHYAHPFAALTLQHGYSSNLTGLVRASISEHRQLAGLQSDYLVSHFGVVTLSGAASRTEAGWGAIGTLAVERRADDVSIALSRRTATRDYGEIGREPSSLHFSDTARISFDTHRLGIASLIYVSEQPWASGLQTRGVRLAGLAWNAQPSSRVSAYASVLRTLNGGGLSIVAGISVALGAGTSGSVQGSRDGTSNGATVALQHSPAERLGWSYAASASSQADGLRQAEAVLTTERGSYGGGWAGFGNTGSPNFIAQTGIAYLDGNAFWTRPIQNSFAVVDAGSSAGVGVYRENQLVGTTDSHGRLLVPDLLPFSRNRLSIDATALPLGAALGATGEQIAPPANAGVPVHFKVDERPATRLDLYQSDGVAVPAGAVLWLDGRELPLPVGYDGLVYASIAEGKHVLEARWQDGGCRLHVQIVQTALKMEFCRKLTP